MCTWNDDTPAIVPAGARISAGKLGSVARSLPNAAESSVKRSPTSCIPSPESPANRITTPPSVSTRRVGLASRVTVDLSFLGFRAARSLLGPGALGRSVGRRSAPRLGYARARETSNRQVIPTLYRHSEREPVPGDTASPLVLGSARGRRGPV